MAYTAPVYDASAQTWTNLKARGLYQYVQTALAGQSTNPPTATATELVGKILTLNQSMWAIERAKNVVDNYINGKSDKTNAKLQIFDLQQAYGEIAACLGEIGVLVDAN